MRSDSRRPELLEVALDMFAERGYAATSIADLASALGLSKAAVAYHAGSKEELLVELVSPLLDDLDAVVAAHGPAPSWPRGVRALLVDYLEVLLRHRRIVVWIDGDKSVLNHPRLGARLRANNRLMRRAIAGDQRADSKLAAAAVLGALWRPLRNVTEVAARPRRDSLVDIALSAARTVRKAS